MLTASPPPNAATATAPATSADIVDNDIYFVSGSIITRTAVAIAPARQSMNQTVERQTRKPFPPLNP